VGQALVLDFPSVQPALLKQHSVAKNTTVLTIAFIIQKILSLVYFTYLARQIGDSNLGRYTAAIAFVSIFSIFADFGLGPVLIREGARDLSRLPKVLSEIVSLKLLLSFGTILVSVIAIQILSIGPRYDLYDQLLVYVALLFVILDSFTFTFYSVFRAVQRMHYEAIGILGYQLFILILGAFLISRHAPIHLLLGVITLSSALNFFFSGWLVISKAKMNIALSWDRKIFRQLLLLAIPFALAGIFFKLNGSVDSIMIKSMVGNRPNGWYNLAFKLATALTVLPGAFATSLFPAMSHAFISDHPRLVRLFEQAMIYLLAMSLPIAIGTFVLAKPLIEGLLYSVAWSRSVPALQIFMIGLVFVFLNYPVGNFLMAVNKQVRNTVHMGIALAINVMLNILLIPWYSYLGAAVAAVVSSIILVGLGLPVVYRTLPFHIPFLLVKSAKLLLASLGMGLVTWWMRDTVPLIANLIFSMVFYTVFVFLIRAFTWDDVRVLVGSLRRRLS
jgi:O-antigen/teichoic acid export membrane protein